MRLLRAYLDLVSRWHWSLLLSLLVATIVLEAAAAPEGLPLSVGLTLNLLILLGAVHTAGLSRGWRRAGSLLLLCWTGFRIGNQIVGGPLIEGTTAALSAAVAIGTLALTLQQLLTLRDNLDALFGAIFGYVLIALTWGVLYQQVEIAAPGSFALGAEAPTRADFTYFSLVSLTTLGYGDILPVSPLARVLAGLEAAIGTLYVAVFIGRIVGRLGTAREERPEGASQGPAV